MVDTPRKGPEAKKIYIVFTHDVEMWRKKERKMYHLDIVDLIG